MKKLWKWLFGKKKQQCNIHDVSKNEVAGCDYCRDEQGFTIGNMYVDAKLERRIRIRKSDQFGLTVC